METLIIDGKKIAQEKQAQLKQEIETFARKPQLSVILVGDNPASVIYVNNKKKAAQKVGIDSEVYQLSPVITQDALESFIKNLNNDDSVDGILVQLPLPKHLDEERILEAIDPKKDVDGLHRDNLGNLFIGREGLIPCTPLACMELIHGVVSDLVGKTAVVVGRSRLVGKPLAQLLLQEHCTVIQAHSRTKNLSQICQLADILVCATGKVNLIHKEDIKEGAVLIDVGISRAEDNKIVGDIAYDEMLGKAKAITPVPGGVGPMTVTMLLVNVVEAYKKRLQK